MNEKKYAILDTDFVSKSNIIMIDEGHVLADRVLEFPEYSFSCHEMLVEELNRHGTRKSQSWLEDKIINGVIEKYTDEDILNLLFVEVGEECYSIYLRFLKTSCDIYEKNYFEEKYASLVALLNNSIAKQDFLDELKKCDDKIGVHQSLGEKKAYVLLQTLRFTKGNNVFFFCSDDFGARCAMAYVACIPCISVVAIFMKLKNMGVTKSEAAPYFQSYIEWCNRHKQTQLYVWKINGAKRRVKWDLQDVFDGLYKDEFSLMINGDLLIK
ncbi:MAG: hypothetical protein LUF27_17205 [Lachnospiraceae bacterium]|nr:hypothetical protein [Lachnospiraceae bacterium]